jgi:hypothetical protein
MCSSLIAESQAEIQSRGRLTITGQTTRLRSIQNLAIRTNQLYHTYFSYATPYLRYGAPNLPTPYHILARTHPS